MLAEGAMIATMLHVGSQGPHSENAMPVFKTELHLNCPPTKVFEFIAQPANLLQVSPPELHLKMIEAPQRVALGSRITIQGSKFGISQKIVSEVTAFEEGRTFTDTQVSGPFGRFVHTHTVEPDGDGTRLIENIDYASPGGLTGLLMTNDRIGRDLEAMAAFREERFKALLNK